MALQAVFLDVGDTLLRENPSRFEIYAEAARSRGLAVDARAMAALMRRAHGELPETLDGNYRYTDPWFEAFIQRIFGHHLGLESGPVGELTLELFERFERAETFRVHAGAEALIDACRGAGLHVGVISNWSARLSRVLAAVGLAERFDSVLCSALEGLEKPDPALFLAAVRRAGVQPGEALHAGDHPEKDGYGARNAGLEAVLVDHGQSLPAGVAPGIPRVGGLPQLRRLILSRLP